MSAVLTLVYAFVALFLVGAFGVVEVVESALLGVWALHRRLVPSPALQLDWQRLSSLALPAALLFVIAAPLASALLSRDASVVLALRLFWTSLITMPYVRLAARCALPLSSGSHQPETTRLPDGRPLGLSPPKAGLAKNVVLVFTTAAAVLRVAALAIWGRSAARLGPAHQAAAAAAIVFWMLHVVGSVCLWWGSSRGSGPEADQQAGALVALAV